MQLYINKKRKVRLHSSRWLTLLAEIPQSSWQISPPAIDSSSTPDDRTLTKRNRRNNTNTHIHKHVF